MQCIFTKNGKRCRAHTIINSQYCFFHDPSNAKKRANARKQGGFNRRIIKRIQQEYHPIKSIKDINAILESAINEARTLESSQSQLRVLAYLCQIALKGQEIGSLEERLSAAEEIIDDIKRQR